LVEGFFLELFDIGVLPVGGMVAATETSPASG
jgi:hypothetical protein